MYLPEGGYPARLTVEDPLFDVDPARECFNRCRNASVSNPDDYSAKAFYLRNSDGKCACASDDCDPALLVRLSQVNRNVLCHSPFV
jgi:hypothetical protein